jgi:ribosomal protein L21E
MNKIITVFFLFACTITTAQDDCTKYKNDYIPVDLTDAITFFKCAWPKDDLANFKNKEEEKATAELHFGAGLYIRNNWKLWGGSSKIATYFHNLGIHHPDDMSGIIFKSLHRTLNNKPVELEKQIQYYKDFWAASEQRKKEREKRERLRQEEEFREYKVGDIVEFGYDDGFISKRQEKKWYDYKCIAFGIIKDLNPKTLEIKVKLKKSCDRRGIIIAKYDILIEGKGKHKRIRKDYTKVMRRGQSKWTFYDLWEIIEEKNN